MNTEEIKQKYLALHDALGSQKDAEDKDEFDQKHRQIWHDCDVELQQRKSELEAKSTLTDEERVELDELEMMFPTQIEAPPSRDFDAEIDDLRARVGKLERK